MTVARSVADVLTEHVQFEIECIDRMYLQRLCSRTCSSRRGWSVTCNGSWGCRSPRRHRWRRSPTRSARRCTVSPAINRVPWVDFAKGQRKDDVMHEHLAGFTATEGVLFIGRAQEKTALFRTEKRRDAHGDSYPWIVKTTGLVNQFYFYCVDADFGPFFLKFCSYFPYNAKLCLNGNEWAKRQAAKAGIGFTALDNGFAAVDDPAAVQAICDRARARPDRRAAAQVAGHAAAPVHRRRSGRRLPLRAVDPAGRVLPDPDAGQTGVGSDVLRAGHPRQPRHRPPRPGQPGLRPPADAARAPRDPGTGSGPG